MKTLVIVRHAHRSKSLGAEANNGLSPKGKKQAQKIAKFFKKRFLGARTPPQIELISSPKKRCIETLKPVSELLGIPLKTSESLIEGGHLEKNIEQFLIKWNQSRTPLTLICSHGDWIPAFFKKHLGITLELKKGAWAEIEVEQDHKKLTWVIQEF